MTENREVKSDVFSMLMEDKEYALQVYNAVNDSDYDDPELVMMKTLEKGISLSIRNDAAFILDMNMNIYEHQSTYNPNMPLRSLIYVVEIVKPFVKEENLFGRKKILIPTPKFVVFYNGREDRPSVETLKLSDSFVKPTDTPELELICTIYNINPGKNDTMLAGCKVLLEYTQFIEKVREFEKANLDNPIMEAINWSIDKGILKDFLSNRREEVLKAMTIDMTFERREELIRRDSLAEGISQGRSEGILQGISQGETSLSILIQKLLDLGRIEDVNAATSDSIKREELYREFGIK